MSDKSTHKIDIDVIEYKNTCEKIKIQVVDYKMFESACCQVSFLDAEENYLRVEHVWIKDDDFNLYWNTDEDLIDLVMKKVNVHKKGTAERIRKEQEEEEERLRQIELERLQMEQQLLVEEQENEELEQDTMQE
jgi:hypothetical protein